MNVVWNRFILALRKGLYLFAIEQDVAEIKLDVVKTKQDILKIIEAVSEIKKAMEDQDLRTSAVHAMLMNQQHQHLDITLSEFKKVMHELSAFITEEHTPPDEADRQ